MPQSSTPETSSGAPAVRLDAGVEVEELTDELGRRYVVGEELGRGVLTVVRSALLREVDGPRCRRVSSR